MCKHPKSGPRREADSKAGFQTDHLGSLEVFWLDITPGWYWHSCQPGCLPDNDPEGPYLTSEDAFEAASAYGPDFTDVSIPMGEHGNCRVD